MHLDSSTAVAPEIIRDQHAGFGRGPAEIPVHESPIRQRLEHLDRSRESVRFAIEQLAEKLTPVLRPPTPNAEKEKNQRVQVTPNCEFDEAILKEAVSLDDMAAELNALLDRLQV